MSNFFLFSTKVLLLIFSDLVQKSKSKYGFMRRAAHNVVKLPIEFSFVLKMSGKSSTYELGQFEVNLTRL